MAGNNSCGSRSIEYGNMVHNVLSMEATLADGFEGHFGSLEMLPSSPRMLQIVEQLRAIASEVRDDIREQTPKVLRRVAGYNIDLFDCQNPRPYSADGVPNLAHLLVGSEGTLATTRALTLKLSPLPRHRVLGVVNFSTFYHAMDMAQHIVTLQPQTVELVDRTMIELSQGIDAFRSSIESALVGTPDALLLVEFAGENLALQKEKLKRLTQLMADHGFPGQVVEMVEEAPQKALWEVRKSGLNIMMSMKGQGKPVSFVEDCAVPLPHLAEYTRRLTEVFHKHGTEGTWYAHASVGTLHVRPILDMRRDGAQKMRAIAEEASQLVREYKGAYSGEHGDGLCRGEWVSWQYGPRVHQAFVRIKDLLDPTNRLNPDKIVRPPKMDEQKLFRLNPDYRVSPYRPALDWSSYNVVRDPLTGQETPPGSGPDPMQGLMSMVEMCNNNGHCRKFDAGTMCPSYRITREEIHLTRGRANTLRLALSGQLGPGSLNHPAVAEAMDLCVSCKGCKRECPTGVHMAKLKIEHLAVRTAEQGLSLRSRMIAYLPRYAATARRFRFVVNQLPRLPLVGLLLRKAVGFGSRNLPAFEQPVVRSIPIPSVLPQKSVLIFADTFSLNFESENLAAAQQVLEQAGYRVFLSSSLKDRPLCCGRTFLSAGLVDEARQEAQRTLDTLQPFLDQGCAIVGLEPSCLLTLKDEFLSYGWGEAAQRLARQTFLFEEFLVQEQKLGRLKLALRPQQDLEIAVHGHCHQKAFDAMTPVMEVLKWIPGAKVNLIQSSCCGMAGSFGYEAEHEEASIAMASLDLLPALQKLKEGTLVVADGTSCRHQIKDLSKHNPQHVARLLAQLIQE
jgi:Fe-S oxidoreductase/FAD/FMN-containing dehydrogenase